MDRRTLCARLAALALGAWVMTASAVAAHPVTLRIADAPDTARIGGPLMIELTLHNGAEDAFQAPDDAAPFRLRLRAEDGRIYEMAADQRAREIFGASSPPDMLSALQGGETMEYRMDAAPWLLNQPEPGRYALSAHYFAQGVAFDSPPVPITLTAAPVTAAAWFRAGAEDAALGLVVEQTGDARGIAILRTPEGRPDLFLLQPLAGDIAADRLSLPVQVDLAPTLALALSGGTAQVLRLDGSGAGATFDTGLGDPVALGGLEQDGAAVWIVADRAAPGTLIRLQAGADGALTATPLPAAGPHAAVTVLIDQGRGALMLIHAADAGAVIRAPDAAEGRPLPLPPGRILSLGAPRMAPHDMAFVDAVIAAEGGATLLARAPLTGDAPGPAAALPQMRAQIESWIWPDLAMDDPQVVAVARGAAALIGLRGGQAHVGKRLRQIAPDADRMALLALTGRGLWLAQASATDGMRIERADLP